MVGNNSTRAKSRVDKLEQRVVELITRAEELLSKEDQNDLSIDLMLIPRKECRTPTEAFLVAIGITSSYLNRYARKTKRQEADSVQSHVE